MNAMTVIAPLLVVLALTYSPVPSPAPPQPAPPLLSEAQASRIVEGCAAHARAKQQSHAIAVVDAGGHLLAALRMQRSGYGAMDFALQKAMAVSAWRFPTSEMAAGATEVPGFARAPHVVTVAGGVPAFDQNGTFVGAVGASGEAPTDDESCARAGIVAAGLLTERKRG
jgi:uncharacterized protein GlcG (DUF336 family)